MKRRSADVGVTAVADAELQADVMRFVAILALCLVAISTLVEDRPGAAEIPAPIPGPASPAPDSGTAASPPATPDTLPAAGGADRSPPRAAATEVVPLSSLRVPDHGHDHPSLDPAPPPARDQGGLSLRFATDAALLRLAARGDAKVFALAGREALELDLSDGVRFRSSRPPQSYYAMSPGTVPGLLLRAYPGPADPIWGVTLPDRTAADIDAHLARADSGVLVIDSAGRVSLETPDG